MLISESGEIEKILYKINLIGDSSIGQACLFQKMTTGEFSEK